MKSLTNDSLQRLEVYFNTDRGNKRVWIMPKETIVVPNSYLSQQVKNLSERRLLTIRGA